MKNKVIVSLTMLFVMCISIFGTNVFAADEVCKLTFSGTDKKVAPGKTVELVLKLSDIKQDNGISGIDANIEFDENVFGNLQWKESNNYVNFLDENEVYVSLQRKGSESTTNNEDVLTMKLTVKDSVKDGKYYIKLKDIDISAEKGSSKIEDVTAEITVDKNADEPTTNPGNNTTGNQTTPKNNVNTPSANTNKANVNTKTGDNLSTRNIPKTGISTFVGVALVISILTACIAYFRYRSVK